MKESTIDNDRQAEKIQIDLLRKASVSKRLQLVNSLVQTTRWLSWQAICERYPTETERFRLEHFLVLLYNDETLAQKVGYRLFGR
jgi:hypothetical protein